MPITDSQTKEKLTPIKRLSLFNWDNNFMVVGIRILFCFFAITLLSSCIGPGHIPVDNREPYKPASYVLDGLIGKSREVVVEKLGRPTKQFSLFERQFILYATSTTRTYQGVAWVIIPIPEPGGKEDYVEVSCLMIELGFDDLVKQYKFKNLSFLKESLFWGEL